jgi:DNA polymerase-1
MRTVAFDTETHRIKPGMLAPRLVCLSWADEAGACALLNREDGLAWFRAHISDPDVMLVGANVYFDLAVLAAEDAALVRPIFEAARDGRVRDAQLRQKMIDVARGERKFRYTRGKMSPAKVSLKALCAYWLGIELEKENTPRLDYYRFDGLPISAYPPDAHDYAIKDAVVTMKVWQSQDAAIHDSASPWKVRRLPVLHDETHQNRAAWALHLMSVWGLRCDAEYVDKLVDALRTERVAIEQALVAAGIMRSDGSKDMKKLQGKVDAWFRNAGQIAPRTDPSKKFPSGQVKTDKETLEMTSDPDLLILAAGLENEKILTNWVKHMEAGALHPLCPRYDSLLETGRTSAQDPPIQTPARKGGVRESFVPRAGWTYAFADYDTLELRTLAKECEELVGYSAMADALRRGEDLHLAMAAQMMGISYADALARKKNGDVDVAEKRQLCKIANFGFPGGMVPRTFREYARGYGVEISESMAQALHDTWKRSWPEMERYFTIIKGMIGPSGEGTIVQSKSLRIRGMVHFCAACNTRFQGRAADGAKEALWRLAWECYVGTRYGAEDASPLAGCRPVLFMHDEVGMEIPPWTRAATSAAADRLGEVMVEAMGEWVQGIPVKAGPVIMKRWYKGAEALRVDGLLVPVKPENHTDEKGKEKVRWVADL